MKKQMKRLGKSKNKEDKLKTYLFRIGICLILVYLAWSIFLPKYVNKITETTIEDDGTNKVEVTKTYTTTREKPYIVKLIDNLLFISNLGVWGFYLYRYTIKSDMEKEKKNRK